MVYPAHAPGHDRAHPARGDAEHRGRRAVASRASRADYAAGSAFIGIITYEAFAVLTGRPKVTDLCRRHPMLAHALSAAWLLHVFAQAREAAMEIEACDGWR